MKRWLERIRQPLCTHQWEVIGHALDRDEGYQVVVECQHCGARQQVAPRAHFAAPAMGQDEAQEV